ncbi:MAG: fimbrillin family protein, partial [Prevotellaceae bacterium]|nr:fimbrillin family protein [Prevotellaceae bacterium]
MKQRKSPFVGTLSLVMLLLAGCSQEVVINDSPNARSGKYIAFNPLIEKSDTRAEVITNDNLESFAVWAAGELPALTENLVLNDVLVYRNKENKWVYNPEVLWSASTMDFYAYAPALSTNVKSTFAPNGSTITYTVKQEKNKGVINQEDFLVAYKKKVDRNAGTVVLQFQHALSRARFEARSGVEGVNLIIKKVELHNLKAVGDLDFENAGIPSSGGFTYDDINHTPLVTLWTNQRSPINYDVARTRDSGESNSFIMVDNTMTQIHTDANALMVLPQQTVLAVIDQSNGNVTNINGEDTNPSSGDEPFYISVVWALSTNPSQEMTTNFPVLFPGLD